MLDALLQDLRYAARGLRRAPAFTLAAVLTLGLGIGANTAAFTVVDAALLRALPYRDQDRLVQLWESAPRKQRERQLSYPDFADVRDSSTVFEAVAGYAFDGFTLSSDEGAERLAGARVSAGFFRVLGVEPVLGRGFRPEEDQEAAKREVVVLSHGLWQRRFGSDPGVVGRRITLGGEPYTVVGVLPRSFHFARLGDPEIFATLAPSRAAVERRYMHWMWALARLRPGVGLEQANAELAGIARARERLDPRWHEDSGLYAVPLRDAIVGGVRPLLLGLLAAVALVLLIACLNVANMLLARAGARRRELGIRTALGADRARLVRQLLTESLLLALLGGAAGLLWAGGGVRALVAAIPEAQRESLPFLKDLALNPAVLAFTTGACLLTGLVFGLAPALHACDRDVALRLKESGRGSARRQGLRSALVVGELALALVLVVAAGLLTRSLSRLLAVDPGFETSHLLTARIGLPAARYAAPQQVEAFFGRWRSRIESLPGVAGVALVDRLPLLGSGNTGTPSVVGRPASDVHAPDSELRTVSSEYFRTMGIALRAGRGFDERDRADAPRVAVVNQTFADALFPDADPLGQRVGFAFLSGPPLAIVGVVADEKVGELDARTRPVFYFHWLQEPRAATSVVVRTRSDPHALLAALRAESRALEPELLVAGVRTMEELIAGSQASFLRRYPLLLLGSFAALALALAAIGVYGVMSYSVSQRTNEIGIRLALGAAPGNVLALVLKEGLALALLGAAAGLGGALATARVLSSLLFETPPTDPSVLTVSALVLLAVAALACWLPARRAARTDPLAAIRCE